MQKNKSPKTESQCGASGCGSGRVMMALRISIRLLARHLKFLMDSSGSLFESHLPSPRLQHSELRGWRSRSSTLQDGDLSPRLLADLSLVSVKPLVL